MSMVRCNGENECRKHSAHQRLLQRLVRLCANGRDPGTCGRRLLRLCCEGQRRKTLRITRGGRFCSSGRPSDASVLLRVPLQLQIDADAVCLDAGYDLKLVSRSIHYDPLYCSVVGFIVFGKSEDTSGFDYPVEEPLVVVGEECRREDKFSVSNAQPDANVGGMRRVPVNSEVRAVSVEDVDGERNKRTAWERDL